MHTQVCNMISNIKNSQLANKSFAISNKQKTCEQILNFLWDEGFILGYKIIKKNPNKLKIFLKYHKGYPVINSIKIVSKPSLRVYYSLKKIWKLDSSKDVVIISTSKGLLSISECKKKKIGGEPFMIIK